MRQGGDTHQGAYTLVKEQRWLYIFIFLMYFYYYKHNLTAVVVQFVNLAHQWCADCNDSSITSNNNHCGTVANFTICVQFFNYLLSPIIDACKQFVVGFLLNKTKMILILALGVFLYGRHCV